MICTSESWSLSTSRIQKSSDLVFQNHLQFLEVRDIVFAMQFASSRASTNLWLVHYGHDSLKCRQFVGFISWTWLIHLQTVRGLRQFAGCSSILGQFQHQQGWDYSSLMCETFVDMSQSYIYIVPGLERRVRLMTRSWRTWLTQMHKVHSPFMCDTYVDINHSYVYSSWAPPAPHEATSLQEQQNEKARYLFVGHMWIWLIHTHTVRGLQRLEKPLPCKSNRKRWRVQERATGSVAVWPPSGLFNWSCVTWLIHMCDMTHPYMCVWSPLGLFNRSCVIWLIIKCGMTNSYVCVWSPSNLFRRPCVTWLSDWERRSLASHIRPYVWHMRNAFMWGTWLIHMCVFGLPWAFSEGLAWHDWAICVTYAWWIHVSGVTRS